MIQLIHAHIGFYLLTIHLLIISTNSNELLAQIINAQKVFGSENNYEFYSKVELKNQEVIIFNQKKIFSKNLETGILKNMNRFYQIIYFQLSIILIQFLIFQYIVIILLLIFILMNLNHLISHKSIVLYFFQYQKLIIIHFYYLKRMMYIVLDIKYFILK